MKSKKSSFQLQRMLGVVVCGGSCAFVGAQSTEKSVNTYPPVQVVETPLEYRQFEKVEITGSSIIRKDQTQALPVQVITQLDIQRSGLKNLVDVIQRLPVMFNFREDGQTDTLIGGYSNASIHGVANATLVLINGRRLAPFGRQTSAGPERSEVDLGTLPLGDVERIEVLTDGASSLYGSDAMAGVVNIILRSERKGFEISTDATTPDGGKGARKTVYLSWGQGSLRRDGYSLWLSGEASQRDELKGQDRPYASQGQYLLEHNGQIYSAQGPLVSYYSSPPTYYQLGSNPKFANEYFQNNQCPTGTLQFSGQSACLVNNYSKLGIYPKEKSHNLRAKGQMVLPSGQTVYVEAMFGHRRQTLDAYLWTTAFAAVNKNPLSPSFQKAASLGLDPNSSFLFWQPNLEPLQLINDSKSLNLSAGISGEYSGWDYRGQVYQSHAEASRSREVVAIAGLSQYTAVNIVNPLNENNPLTQQLLNGRGNFTPLDKGKTRIDAMELRASKSLAEIDGKDVMVGVGFDVRSESSMIENYANNSSNTTLFQSNYQPSFDGKRKVMGAYSELQIPVSEKWDVNLGVRSDKYSDVGKTHNFKVSTRWEPSSQWAIRASAGSGFRAPTVGQVKELPNSYLFGYASASTACTAELKSIAGSQRTASGVAGLCDAGKQFSIYGNGNSQLKPENSNQATLGLAFTPTRNFYLGVDYWRVDIKNSIRYLPEDVVINNPTNYVENFTLNSIGKLALYLPMINLGNTRKSGLDMEFNWRKPLDAGRINVSGQGTYMLESKQQLVMGSDWTSDLGKYSKESNTVTPRFRGRLAVGWTQEKWSNNIILNYTNGYKDMDVYSTNTGTLESEKISGRKVTHFTTVDLTARYEFMPNMDFRLGILNIFNRDAPISMIQSSSQVFGINTIYSNAWGRTLQLGATIRF